MRRVDGFPFAKRGDALWFCATAVGLALCLVLTGTFDTILATHVAVASFDYRIAGAPVSGNAPVVAACAVAAVAAWSMRGVRRFGWGHAAALALAQGAACTALFTLPDSRDLVAVALWWVLALCSTVQLVVWAQVLSGIGRARALALFACALLLDGLLNLADGLLPSGGVAVLCVCAALASPCLLGAFQHAVHRPDGPFREASDKNDVASVEAIPLGLSMACLACYGVVVGTFQSSGVAAEYAGLVPQAVQIASVVLSCALLVFAVRFERLRNPDALIRVFVLTVLVAAVYCAGSLGSSGSGAGAVIMSVVRTAVFSYVWVLACEALPHPTRAAFVFASGWGVFTLAHTLSTKLGIAVAGSEEPAAYGLLVAGSLVCLVVANAYPQFARRGEARGLANGGADAASCDAASLTAEGDEPTAPAVSAGGAPARQGAADLYERGCARLAECCGLTAREAEVLLPLVRGRSNSSIAAALTVGTETVRTHIRHIYQKTGIHSREELMDTVEELGSGK